MTLSCGGPDGDPAKAALVAQFVRSFGHLRDQPIALYGLGPNTQHLLKSVKGFTIIGLMDPENIGRQVFGLPVLSKDEAASRVKAVVIVARTAVIPIIHARIADLAGECGIAIYDVGGNLLSCRPHPARSPWRAAPGSDEEALRQAIARADVISFDVFDTLLIRRVARPENVFDLVEGRVRSWLGRNLPFKRERLAAEQTVGERCCAPTIAMIYQELAPRLGLGAAEAATLMAEEIAVEAEVLVRRETMVAIFDHAVATGKPVYLVSDMYLGRHILSDILREKGIGGYSDLIVSCDIGRTKRSGDLFSYFRGLGKGDDFLHIGDDPVADLAAPMRLGFQTFPITSGYDMLLASPFAHLLSEVSSASDALALGLAMAQAFNDPFVFHLTSGRLPITSGNDLGYLGYGAIVTAIVRWLMDRTAGQTDATILFGARDGYLFHRLYLRMVEASGRRDLPHGVYFLTSRRAAAVPSIHDRRDILTLLDGVAGQPTFRDILQSRFGVTPAATDRRADQRFNREAMAEVTRFVLDYEKAILAQATAERTAYRQYVASLFLIPEGKLFFFDLITSGTIPHFLPHVLERDATCLCVLMNHPPKFCLPAGFDSFLGLAEPYDRSRHFARGHYLAESIFTAPDPELRNFNAAGEAAYGEHDDSHSRFDRTMPVRDGITAYVEAFLALAGPADIPPISPKLADGLVGMVLSDECQINDALKEDFLIGDRYTFMPPLNPWLTVPPPANDRLDNIDATSGTPHD